MRVVVSMECMLAVLCAILPQVNYYSVCYVVSGLFLPTSSLGPLSLSPKVPLFHTHPHPPLFPHPPTSSPIHPHPKQVLQDMLPFDEAQLLKDNLPYLQRALELDTPLDIRSLHDQGALPEAAAKKANSAVPGSPAVAVETEPLA